MREVLLFLTGGVFWGGLAGLVGAPWWLAVIFGLWAPTAIRVARRLDRSDQP